MKEFNLDEYLKNPKRKIVTRNGENVRIICTNAKGNFPIIALVETHNSTEAVLRLKENGHFYNDTKDSRDLFFSPEKKEGWINLFKDSDIKYVGYKIFESKEEAEKAGKNYNNYIVTAKVEWEE